MEKKGTPASPATALASSVLPVPGGPTSSRPLGILAPTLVYFWGLRRKSTTSSSSSFSSSSPATLLKFTLLSRLIRARLLPKFIILALAPPPPALRFITMIMITTTTVESRMGRATVSRIFSWGTLVTL